MWTTDAHSKSAVFNSEPKIIVQEKGAFSNRDSSGALVASSPNFEKYVKTLVAVAARSKKQMDFLLFPFTCFFLGLCF